MTHATSSNCYKETSPWFTLDCVKDGSEFVASASRSKKPTSNGAQSAPRAKALQGRPEVRGRQVVRQLTILRALENARRGLTVAQLHELVPDGCVLRTVYRDVEQLQQAGFPLVEEDGRWKVTLASQRKAFPLQASEVFSLLLSEDLVTPTNAGALGSLLHDLRQRLMSSLTEAGRGMVEELRGSNLATLAAPSVVHHMPVFDAIDDALGREHCLQLTYHPPGKPATERVVEPHLFWVHAGRPYLVAYCRTRHEFRTFAVQRIADAKVLDKAFERRTDFDPKSFTQRGFGVLHGDVHEVKVEFQPDVAHLAHERRWHSSQRVESAASGAALLTMRVAGLAEVAAWVASFGGKVRALAPKRLVAEVRDMHERGLSAHQTQGR